MTEFFKINEKTYFAVVFEYILSFLPKENFSYKIQLSTISVVLQDLNIKDTEKIGYKIKNYSITIIIQKTFFQCAQFIKYT